MATLTQASQQWFGRPADERFVSMPEMGAKMRDLRERSQSYARPVQDIWVLPDQADAAHQSLFVEIGGMPMVPTHHSFDQLCSLASPAASPARYFRRSKLPAPVVADALNYGLHFPPRTEHVGILAAELQLRAITGPRYGRVWNADIIDMLIDSFGDGVTGEWRVPGEFGEQIEVKRENTTLFASDRDMFVFLADEERRIDVPGRRDGKPGSIARGFFVWNSEVGDKTLGAGFFLFDYVCCNRIVWGADQYTELRIRHTNRAFDRWWREVVPVLDQFSRGSPKPIEDTIEAARRKLLEAGDLDRFLAARFGRGMVETIKDAHEAEEDRPIETVWDVAVAATAAARSLPNTDRRIVVERAAGDLLKSIST